MKKLIVAEKPSVARDIARVLGAAGKRDGYIDGAEYAVTWAIGHLVGLVEPDAIDPKYKKWSMGDLPILPDDIPLTALEGTKKQYGVVSSLMNSPEFDSVVCATDSAREGELIFRYIYRLCGCKKSVERLWISSMTDEAIRDGFSRLRPDSEYDALYDSAQLRSVADWLVGMNASRAFSLRFDAHLSVGRVQTPTLRMIVDRDREIESFVPQEYYELEADAGDMKLKWFDPNVKDANECTRRKDREFLNAVKKKVTGKTLTVTRVKREKKRQAPPQLYDLTTLQREANSRFGWSADKTLKVAQALYEEKKLLTYPRTDSRYLTDDVRPKLEKTLQRLPEPYHALVADPAFRPGVSSRRYYDASRVSDHHAIIPTDRIPGAMSEDERKLYDTVVRRVLEMHYPDYEYESARVDAACEGENFTAQGTVPLVPGWKAVRGEDKKGGDEVLLPNVKQGDGRTVLSAQVTSHKTKPPTRHTDSSVLGMMENAGRAVEDEELRESLKASGLGTPATRAAVIERLIQVGYVQRKGKSLISTQKGRSLIAVTPEQITSPVTTGKWEKMLSVIAGMRQDEALRAQKCERFMSGIRRFSQFLVDAAKSSPQGVTFEKEKYASRRAPAAGAGAGKGAPARKKAAGGKKSGTDRAKA